MMSMQVLFVDDQRNVLDGLRRMLRSMRNDWDMHFAASADEALSLMASTDFDVVVSDMRMPGMDGAELLIETMNRHPGTVRIILSGDAGQDSVLRAVTPAHQYLSKPCDAETLKATVARACALRDTLSSKKLIHIVSRVTTLPSLPRVYSELVEELKSEEASVHRVAELIAQDVGMTAKLMQIVNSSFFGIPRHVESPSQAAALLGLAILKPLVLTAGVFSQFRGDACGGYSVDVLMEHSLAVSNIAGQIADSYSDDPDLKEHTLIAGLLHDVGQLLILENLPKEFKASLAYARENGVPLCDAEVVSIGAHHADMGAYLLGLWGLSNPVVEAVAYHHQPSKCPVSEFLPVTAVHIANALVNEFHNPSGITLSCDCDLEYLERCGITDLLPQWRSMTESYFVPQTS